MAHRIRKAVFPVAGLGTRFLPATKVMPKEMLTLVDRPVIQYGVEEALEAGIEEIIFVTSRGKGQLEDHFGLVSELTATLERRNKQAELKLVAASTLPVGALASVRQDQPLGLGHAVWCARHLVGREPFAVLLPDVVVLSKVSCLHQMADVFARHGGNVIAVNEVPREHTKRYGIVDPASDDGRVVAVKGLVEKPDPSVAPSNLSVTGRYILQPEVFDYLEEKQTGAGGEIQLTDAMLKLVGKQPFHGLRFDGKTYDCGDKIGWLEANLAYALARPDLAEPVRAIAKNLLG
jgi:UTP--glucose-1-phosphate uridylyltransferase